MDKVKVHDLRKIWTTIHYRGWVAGIGCFGGAPPLEAFLSRCGDAHNCTPQQLKDYILVPVTPK